PNEAVLRESITASVVDDDTIRATIQRAYRDHAITLCPHSACALALLQRLRESGDRSDQAIVTTAHPAKFEQVVEPLLGRAVAMPSSLDDLLDRPAHATPLAAEYTALRRKLLSDLPSK
ncbi:MAG: threonine synthase, partial [Dokdonella sp.]